MASSKELTPVWLIERVDTGERLGTRDRYSDAGLEFGARVPLTWGDKRDATYAWIRYALGERWIKRGISLAGMDNSFQPDVNFGSMPHIKLVRVQMLADAFELPTFQDLGINPKL